MVALRLTYQGDVAGKALVRSTSRAADKVRKAARNTAKTAAEQVLIKGKSDIAAAGFTGRWLEGLKAIVTEGGGHIKLTVSHSEPGFNLHEKGGIIRGKPLLWIPLSYTGIRNLWARNFPTILVRVDRKKGGVPLLLSVVDGKPKYFGVPFVTIRKKFHVEEIIRDEAKKLAETYKLEYRALGK